MNTLSMTQLRTRSPELVKALRRGETVTLLHRSRIVGKIEPVYEEKVLTGKKIEQLKKLAEELNLPKLSYVERERTYREHMIKKYGKGLS